MYSLIFDDNTSLEIPHDFVKESKFLSEIFDDNVQQIKLPDITYNMALKIVTLHNTKDVTDLSLEESINILKYVDYLCIDIISTILIDHICKIFHNRHKLLKNDDEVYFFKVLDRIAKRDKDNNPILLDNIMKYIYDMLLLFNISYDLIKYIQDRYSLLYTLDIKIHKVSNIFRGPRYGYSN